MQFAFVDQNHEKKQVFKLWMGEQEASDPSTSRLQWVFFKIQMLHKVMVSILIHYNKADRLRVES